jgi:(1->4)-alpha-D-glucan 1-alpha-D-glucosylmutase
MINSGDITGLRIDHVDGLYNPLQYLRRLRDISGDLYIVVEKIMNSSEILPSEWDIQGTTGYDYMNQLNGLFCRIENGKKFSKIYFNFTDQNFRYNELVAEKKRMIIEKHMTGDVDNLAALLKQFSGGDRFGRDITMHGLRNALVELIAFFPVYRTYINSDKISVSDSGYIRFAFEQVRKYTPEYSFEYDFLEKCLTLQYIERMDEVKTSELIHFIMRFQQYTGPFMAKGFEDTVLYILNRLVSLNEVGGNPAVFGITTEQYNDYISTRSLTHMHSMNATSTHDSKRGEDVRSRINVLSEIPAEWNSAVRLWGKINHVRKRRGTDGPVPDRNDEYFIYQTLIGTFPGKPDDYELYVQRIRDYLIKSVREAKVHTAWVKPDNDYEENLLLFINRILLPLDGNRFLEQFIPFQKLVSFYGILNSLSQVIVKITSPGVPDFYQGTELWDYRLVDPDNRIKVDFRLRMKYLEYITDREKRDLPALLNELWDTRTDGRIKLFLIHRLLRFRKNMKELFDDGEYIPLATAGRFRNSLIAFMRRRDDDVLITIAPRFLTSVVKEGDLPTGEVWQDTALIIPDGFTSVMRDVLTESMFSVSGEITLKKVLTVFPVAVLAGKIQQKN